MSTLEMETQARELKELERMQESEKTKTQGSARHRRSGSGCGSQDRGTNGEGAESKKPV